MKTIKWMFPCDLVENNDIELGRDTFDMKPDWECNCDSELLCEPIEVEITIKAKIDRIDNKFEIKEFTVKWRNGSAGTKTEEGPAFYVIHRALTIGPFRSKEKAEEYAKEKEYTKNN